MKDPVKLVTKYTNKWLEISQQITDRESNVSRVQMKRRPILENYYCLVQNKPPIDMGAQISPPNQPIERLKNIYVTSRFICTRENFGSPSVNWMCVQNLASRLNYDYWEKFDKI